MKLGLLAEIWVEICYSLIPRERDLLMGPEKKKLKWGVIVVKGQRGWIVEVPVVPVVVIQFEEVWEG